MNIGSSKKTTITNKLFSAASGWAFYLLLYVIGIFLGVNSSIGSYFCLAITFIFMVKLIWNLYQIESLSDKIEFKLIIYFSTLVIAILSKHEANNLLNSIFEIDPNLLPISQTIASIFVFVTYSYILIPVLLIIAMIYLAVFVKTIVVALTINEKPKNDITKTMGFVIFIVTLISNIVSAKSHIENDLITTAYIFDFNKKNRCDELHENSTIKKVLFIGDEKVLYLENQKPKIMECKIK